MTETSVWKGSFVDSTNCDPLHPTACPPLDRTELIQVDRKTFELNSSLTYIGATRVKDLPVAARTVGPGTLPTTDLASVPAVLRWFVGRYGVHTPAALVHDRPRSSDRLNLSPRRERQGCRFLLPRHASGDWGEIAAPAPDVDRGHVRYAMAEPWLEAMVDRPLGDCGYCGNRGVFLRGSSAGVRGPWTVPVAGAGGDRTPAGISALGEAMARWRPCGHQCGLADTADLSRWRRLRPVSRLRVGGFEGLLHAASGDRASGLRTILSPSK